MTRSPNGDLRTCVYHPPLEGTYSNIIDALVSSDIIFIAVGTPMGEDGSADLQYVLSVAKSIGENMKKHILVVDKSTVPIGTADKVREEIQRCLDERGSVLTFDVASNPEFLKELMEKNPAARTMPQIYKDDQLIGGYDQLVAHRAIDNKYGL